MSRVRGASCAPHPALPRRLPLPRSFCSRAAPAAPADGSLTFAHEAEATTAADGSYSLDVLLDGAEQDLLLEATHESSAGGSVILSGSLAPGEQIVAAPIDGESSVEGDIYVDIAGQGNWGENSSSGMLRAWVSADLAADLSAASDYAAAIAASARANAAAMAAWSSMMTEEAVGAARSDVEAALEIVAAIYASAG